MIFISTALYCEAKIFIEKFKLKKDNLIHKFQVFKSKDIILIISGVGEVNSVAASVFILSKFSNSKKDIFINIGVCGTINKSFKKGDLFICNKVINGTNKKIFYPDLIYPHNFRETSLESFSKVLNNKDNLSIEGNLIDMEGAFLFEGVSIFLSLENIFLLKIVSDYLDGEQINKDFVLKIIGKNIDIISKWILNLEKYTIDEDQILSNIDVKEIETISDNLKLTVTMKNNLLKLSKKYKVRNDDLENILFSFQNVRCKSKLERGDTFEVLVRKLKSI